MSITSGDMCVAYNAGMQLLMYLNKQNNDALSSVEFIQIVFQVEYFAVFDWDSFFF